MKTLQEIKEDYAQEQGYDDWDELSEKNNYADDYELHWTSVCIRAQKEALEKAAENAKVKMEEYYVGEVAGHIGLTASKPVVARTSITNPENLIL